MLDEIIDTHPHIVSTDTVRYPITPLGGERSEWSRKRSVTFEELVREMDEAGIAKGAIVHSSTTYGFNNDYVADSIKRDRHRFTGVFSVNVTEPDAPEKMRYWHGLGMGGMRIFVRGSTMKEAWMTIDDPVADPAWRCADELGISVVVNTIARREGIGQIAAVARRYPGVRLVVDHLGSPFLEDGPPYAQAEDFFSLSRLGNIYLKVTPNGLSFAQKGAADVESFLRRLVDSFGADHLAWGSNYPSTKGTLKEIVADLRETLAFLPASDRAFILNGTAKTIYPCLASRRATARQER